jgi:hypothetical protein
MNVDLSTTLIRCSSLSCLFTEPKLKVDKEAGNLSQTAKTHLIEVYARELWGVERDIVTRQMQKGIEAESESLVLLSVVEGEFYEKNQIRESNEWVTGHADIVTDDLIIDVKTSWDAFSFLPKLTEEISSNYYYQLQGYMWLYDRPKARISYCLVDTPENIIRGEKYRLLRAMDVVSEEDPVYLAAAAKLESNMKFGHIPPSLRVINHFVDRNDEIIAQIPDKVDKARDFLIDFAGKHLSLYDFQNEQKRTA